MNVNLGDYYQSIINKALGMGLAGNQTEVIRQALLEYGRKIDEEEAILVHKGVQFEMEKMKGKKWIPWEEVKKYFVGV